MEVFEFGIKTPSKRELNSLLKIDVNFDLPPSREVNAKYLSGIISGEKCWFKHT